LPCSEFATQPENFARFTKEGSITADIKLVGNRPAVRTDEKTDLVQLSTAAFLANGVLAHLAGENEPSFRAPKLERERT
jgi:hypothetical protein